jgi:hypothetical protein
MKKQILLEMPWVADVTCPSCGINFDFDAKVENEIFWPFTIKDRKKIINTFIKHRLYAMDCPKCNKGLLYSSKKHKTYLYSPKILAKVPIVIRKFLEQTKDHLTKIVKNEANITVELDERINFKDYCELLKIDKYYESKMSRGQKKTS